MTGQTTTQRTLISSETAMALVQAAVSHAHEQGWTVAAAVCDPFGQLAAFARLDGCPGPVIDYALDKAYTAATLGASTRDFAARMNSSEELRLGATNRQRVCAWPGGVPIVIAGAIVGGLGVSGAVGDDDITCAEAALAAVLGG